MSNIKLTIDGTEYELINANPLLTTQIGYQTAYINGKCYYVKPIPKQSTTSVNTQPSTVTQVKDWEIERYYYNGSDNPIDSVRRLSDGEVFSVGDEISNNSSGTYTEHKILSFKPYENRIKVYVSGTDGYYYFSEIEKVKPKEVLFTTEDSVPYYSWHDVVWWVNKHFDYNSEQAGNYNSSGLVKYFSTKEKAKEYILLNRPVNFTYKEWLEWEGTVKEIFQSKINQL